MDIKNFKCNGISLNSNADKVKPFIQTAISLYRMRNSSHEIIEKLVQNNPKYDYYPGTRFSNNEAIAIRICSGLVELALNSGKQDNTIEENIESFVNSLSGTELDQIILEAMRDCASADHWYAFEKEWD